MERSYLTRGFLPSPDPLSAFSAGSQFAFLDELGRDLPSLLEDKHFRNYIKEIDFPEWPDNRTQADDLAELRLYYVRMGFIASAYINQLGVEPATVLPKNIAVPFAKACTLLNRPPILSYDGYALYNWKRFDTNKPIALGNIDTIQNFVHMYDEHWFILVHVEIEALAAKILSNIDRLQSSVNAWQEEEVNSALTEILESVKEQILVLRRIPEKMDPQLYYKTFRQYIRFFEGVVYEGVTREPMQFRGETGAQSSILPMLDAFLKIPHEVTILTEHLEDMKNYMPHEHREFLMSLKALPAVKDYADKALFDELMEAIAEFREVHIGWAMEYIQRRVEDPRGTGGTPYMRWLKQLIDETREHKFATAA